MNQILIYGSENYLIDKKIEEIKKQFADYKVTNIYYKKDFAFFYEVYSQNDLFQEKELIFVNAFDFKDKKQVEKLINTLSDDNEKIVLFVNYQDFIPKNNLLEKLQSKNKVFEFKKLTKKEKVDYIVDYLKSKNAQVKSLDIYYLIEKSTENLEILIKELDKVLIKENKITKEVIDENIFNYSESVEFAFVNALTVRNFYNLYSKYLKEVAQNKSVITILAQIANFLHLSCSVYYLFQQGKNNFEIAKDLKIHEFRVQKIIEFLNIYNLYNINKLKDIVSELLEIDNKYKSTGDLVNDIFEVFLIKKFGQA